MKKKTPPKSMEELTNGFNAKETELKEGGKEVFDSVVKKALQKPKK